MKLIITMLSLAVSTSAFAMNIKVQDAKNSYLLSKHEFKGFGCSGENKSPMIQISDLPKGTKSLAITIFDPDAPTGGGWWHWLAVNIPVTKKRFALADKSLVKLGVVQTMNSYGTTEFGGPCPPKGDMPHRYIFTAYALKIEKIDVKPSTTPNIVGYQLNSNSIVKATATVLYGR